MTTNNTARKNLLRRAANLVFVNDGTERWLGSKREVYGWLEKHGHTRGYHSGYRTSNSVVLSADEYQSLCDRTENLLDRVYGDGSDLKEALEQRGTAELFIY